MRRLLSVVGSLVLLLVLAVIGVGSYAMYKAKALDASSEAYRLAVIRYKAGLSPQLQVLTADSNRLAAEQTLTNLKMKRRDLQFALIRARGGGFDAQTAGVAAAGSGSAAATPAPAPTAAPAAPAAPAG